MKKNNVYYKKGDNVCLKKVGTHRFDNQIEVVFDLIDGSIYGLDDEHFSAEDGSYRFKNIPITDSPLLIMFGGFDTDEGTK